MSVNPGGRPAHQPLFKLLQEQIANNELIELPTRRPRVRLRYYKRGNEIVWLAQDGTIQCIHRRRPQRCCHCNPETHQLHLSRCKTVYKNAGVRVKRQRRKRIERMRATLVELEALELAEQEAQQ